MNNTTDKRAGKKWNVNEVLTLQREYELLELTIQQIAVRHQRSVEGILFKLEREGFIENWNVARGIDEFTKSYKCDMDEKECCQDDCCDDVSEVDKLTERVWNLETSVSDIRGMVKNMFDTLVQKKNSKQLAPLRKSTR
jgi:plasmid replication initiation protein